MLLFRQLLSLGFALSLVSTLGGRGGGLNLLANLTTTQKSACFDARYHQLRANELSQRSGQQRGGPPKKSTAVVQSGSSTIECASVIDDILLEEKTIEETYIRTIASWDSQSSSNRTKEKQVISFGLYGNKTKYVHGSFANLKLSRIYYPGWKCRFYCAEVDSKVVDLLKAEGAEVVVVSGVGHMMSRFHVANDSTVDRFIVRDVDSRLNSRERFAVQEWIDSGLPLHSMRDTRTSGSSTMGECGEGGKTASLC